MIRKNRSHIYDINRPRHRHNYAKYVPGKTIFICNKQYLSKTWGSIHQEVKQHWETKRADNNLKFDNMYQIFVLKRTEN